MLTISKFPILLLLASAAAAFGVSDRLATSDSVTPGGLHTFVVTNTSNAVLTGMTIRNDDYDATGKRTAWGIRFFDSLLNSDADKLAPGQSHTFDMNSRGKTDLRVDAAIFADGYAEGDPDAIQYLWDLRKWLAIGYQEVFEDFDTKVPDPNDWAAAIAALTQIKDSRSGPPTGHGAQWHSVSNAYDTVIGNIRDNPKVAPQKMVETLRKQMEPRIKAIQSQIRPSQVQP
ncbi:MAG: hypothetical protein JO340_03085 [Acidobacteriaceae bacterium]|nr:hypothetical protein [Acidobacteriaceae bacterium]